MLSLDFQSDPSTPQGLRARGITRAKSLPLNNGASQTECLLAMNARLLARLRNLKKDRVKLSKLLEEADRALAAAGLPYGQDNIRERISAQQVLPNILIFPL